MATRINFVTYSYVTLGSVSGFICTIISYLFLRQMLGFIEFFISPKHTMEEMERYFKSLCVK